MKLIMYMKTEQKEFYGHLLKLPKSNCQVQGRIPSEREEEFNAYKHVRKVENLADE